MPPPGAQTVLNTLAANPQAEMQAAKTAMSGLQGANVGGAMVANTAVAGAGNVARASQTLAQTGGALSGVQSFVGTPMRIAGMPMIAGLVTKMFGGLISGIGNVSGSVVGGIGGFTNLEILQNAGDKMASTGQGISNGLGVASKSLMAPFNAFRASNVSDMHHLPSQALNHVKEQVSTILRTDSTRLQEARAEFREAAQEARTASLASASEVVKDASGGMLTLENLHQSQEAKEFIQTAATDSAPGLRQKIVDGLDNAGESLSGTESSLGEKFGDGIKGLADKAGDFVSNRLGRDQMGESIANAPDKLHNVMDSHNIYETAYKGSLYAGAAIRDIRTISKFAHKMEQITDLYQDMTGNDQAGMFDAMFDKNAPEAVIRARDGMLGKMAPAAAMSLVSDAIAVTMANNYSDRSAMGGGMMMVMAAPMIAGQLLDRVMPHDPLMDTYHDVREAYKSNGGRLTGDMASLLLVMGSPALNKVGPEHPDVMKLADHYVEQQLTPAALMEEITSGRIAETQHHLKRGALGATVTQDVAPDTTMLTHMQPDGRLQDMQRAIGGL